MKQTENFTMRIAPTEQAMLSQLALKFNRSKSDFLRVVIRELWADLPNQESSAPPIGAPNSQSVERVAS